MALENLDASAPQETEAWSQSEAGREIFAMGVRLSQLAFERVGVDLESLQPDVKWLAIIRASNAVLNATISRQKIMLPTRTITRFISVRDERRSRPTFSWGKHVSDAGNFFERSSGRLTPSREPEPVFDILGRLRDLEHQQATVELSFKTPLA